MPLEEQAIAAAEKCFANHAPEARKTGRNPAFPYVAVVRYRDRGHAQTMTAKGCAFATREEAKDYAQQWIDKMRTEMARQLQLPNMRAYRLQWGLPAEV